MSNDDLLFWHAQRILHSFCKYWYGGVASSSPCVLDIEQCRACIDMQYILSELLCTISSVKQLPDGIDLASELDNTVLLFGVLLNFKCSVMLVLSAFITFDLS